MTESSVGSRLTALNVSRSEPTSRSSQSRVTANGGARASAATCPASSGAAAASSGEAASSARSPPGSRASTRCRVHRGGPAPSSTRQRVPVSGVIDRAAVPVRTAVPRASREAGEGVPDAAQVVGVRGVEPDALRVAQEVVVEHRDELPRPTVPPGARRRTARTPRTASPGPGPTSAARPGTRRPASRRTGWSCVPGRRPAAGEPACGPSRTGRAGRGWGNGRTGRSGSTAGRPAARSGPPAASYGRSPGSRRPVVGSSARDRSAEAPHARCSSAGRRRGSRARPPARCRPGGCAARRPTGRRGSARTPAASRAPRARPAPPRR